MWVTSIQASGTATITSAWPKASGLTNTTRSSPFSAASWMRSEPVTPMSMAPMISSRAISAAG